VGGNFSGIRAMREAETALTRRNGRELQITSLHLSELNKIKTLITAVLQDVGREPDVYHRKKMCSKTPLIHARINSLRVFLVAVKVLKNPCFL
jgi:hypothetical protein